MNMENADADEGFFGSLDYREIQWNFYFSIGKNSSLNSRGDTGNENWGIYM